MAWPPKTEQRLPFRRLVESSSKLIGGVCKTVSNPTVTLSIIALRSVGQRTLRVPNIGHFRAIFGSQEGLSGLLNGSLALSVTVGLGAPPAPPTKPRRAASANPARLSARRSRRSR